MPTPDADVAMILDVLEQYEVPYVDVVIGGFAAELHQVAIPPTRDIDVTPDATHDNLRRLATALRQLNARFRLSDAPTDGVDIPGGIITFLAMALAILPFSRIGILTLRSLATRPLRCVLHQFGDGEQHIPTGHLQTTQGNGVNPCGVIPS